VRRHLVQNGQFNANDLWAQIRLAVESGSTAQRAATCITADAVGRPVRSGHSKNPMRAAGTGADGDALRTSVIIAGWAALPEPSDPKRTRA